MSVRCIKSCVLQNYTNEHTKRGGKWTCDLTDSETELACHLQRLLKKHCLVTSLCWMGTILSLLDSFYTRLPTCKALERGGTWSSGIISTLQRAVKEVVSLTIARKIKAYYVLIGIDLHTWNSWLPWMKTSANGDIKNTAFIQKQVTFQTDYS